MMKYSPNFCAKIKIKLQFLMKDNIILQKKNHIFLVKIGNRYYQFIIGTSLGVVTHHIFKSNFVQKVLLHSV
jgi:hypothetical protein